MKFFRHIIMITLALTFGLLVQGCHSENEQEEPNIQLTVRTQTMASNTNSQFIMVNAKGGWSITSNQPWLSIEPSEGSGNYSKIVLTCEENTSSQSRSAVLTLTADGTTMDVSITQTGMGANPDTGTGTGSGDQGSDITHDKYGWIELPAFNTNTYKFVSHEMASSGRTGRSFSYLWSKGDLVALWVAYPLNSSLISSGNRTNNWGMDPKLSTDEQPILYSAYVGGYDRGHQIPSADRLSYNDNVKTFYFTNMTPQLNSLNSNIWASLEGDVRSWAAKSDTLYVVTGCVISGSTKKAYDNNGKAVTVPVGYYKAVVRYMKNSTVGHNGYMGLAVYLEQRAYSEKRVSSSMSMSIDALENMLNIDLFPNLKNVVGESVANTIEAEDPSKVSWWWN